MYVNMGFLPNSLPQSNKESGRSPIQYKFGAARLSVCGSREALSVGVVLVSRVKKAISVRGDFCDLAGRRCGLRGIRSEI